MDVQRHYLSGPRVDERYGISPMTRWRWQRNPSLNFPRPVEINRRKFWKRAELEAWERTREEVNSQGGGGAR